jgi:OmpA-OmpF porin, OOP family
MKKLVYLFYSVLVIETSGFSQNLVRNGSFERGECPDSRNYQGSVCESWNTISTADYFTRCSKGEVRPEDNFIGQQVPYSGEAFAGLFTGHTTNTYITEVLYTELQEPLEKGEKYKVEFYYSLAENSGLISRAIGCAFTEQFAYKEVETPFGIGHTPLFGLNYILVEQDELKLSDSEAWILFQQEFVAAGGEKYLYISGVPVKGNPCVKRKKTLPVNTYADYAYYYIDEVSVIKRIKGYHPVVTSETKVKDGYKEVEQYIFSNVYFNSNSAQLNNDSELSLDTLVDVLEKNPERKVVIQGHADAVGNEKENISLSESRAKAVKDYLLVHGIEAERIKIKAHGSSIPMGSNASEKERAMNRRVEISLIKD